MTHPLFILPVPVLVPYQHIFCQGVVGWRLCPGVRALARKSQSVARAYGLQVHLLVGHAALHGSHGRHQLNQSSGIHAARGLRQMLVPAQAGEPEHGVYVSLRVVLGGWCPSGNDVLHVVALPGSVEMLPVRFQYPPCRPVSVGHGLELYKTLVGLLLAHALPSVGRPTDIERVVVSDSSCHVMSVLK